VRRVRPARPALGGETGGQSMGRRESLRTRVLQLTRSMINCVGRLSRYKHPHWIIRQMVWRCLNRKILLLQGKSKDEKISELELFAKRFEQVASEKAASFINVSINASNLNKTQF
jgi:hypothetical protein